MNKHWLILTGSVCLTAPAGAETRPASETPQQQQPNIIFFLVDDMGWMDCSVYGSKYYETPNMERLARQGRLFTSAYSASPLSSPTRASILTGRYPERFGLTTPAAHMAPNPNAPREKDSDAPWKKMVEPGIRTFMPLEEITIAEVLKKQGYKTAQIGKWHLGQRAYWADKQGFDTKVASEHHPGPPSYFSPYRIASFEDGPDGEYITDRLTDEAIRYIEQNRDTPFYLNVWHYAVHAPFQAQKHLVEKYKQKVDPRGRQSFPIMAAMIESMDTSLGRIMDKLDELGIADNTIIIFFSDNGGNTYNVVDGGFPTNNYPLRGGKGNVYEGGIRVPMIVSWPGRIPAATQTDRIFCSVDFLPTIAGITKAELDPAVEIDGQNMLPLWTGQEQERAPIVHFFPHYVVATDNLPACVVRTQEWKFIRIYGAGEDRAPAYELYRINEDIGERNNLATQYPEIVAELDRIVDRHVEKTGAVAPKINPKYNPESSSPMGTKKPVPAASLVVL